MNLDQSLTRIFLCLVLNHMLMMFTLEPCDTNSIDIMPPEERLPRVNSTTQRFGKIAIIGGSTVHTGAPYFAGISALKTGADEVHIITTERASPIVRLYSPNLKVFPFLHHKSKRQVDRILKKIDIVVIGPGLDKESDNIDLISDIIQTCRYLSKPLVINSHGLYIISKNISLLKYYPNGVILISSLSETVQLIDAIGQGNVGWYKYWGGNVSVLIRGNRIDIFFTSDPELNFELQNFISYRRVSGESEVLAGSLATFFNWAFRSKPCSTLFPFAYAARLVVKATLTFLDICNEEAFGYYRRGMLASDIINVLPKTFKLYFEE